MGPPGPDGEPGESGETLIIQPTLQEIIDFTNLSRFPRRIGMIQSGNLAATGASSVVVTGVPLCSFDGTPGAVIQGTGGINGGFGYFGSHTTSTATGNVAGNRSTAEWTQYQNKPIMRLYFRTGNDVSNLRFWMGVFSTLPTTTDDPVGHVAGVRFSNASGGAGDTVFRFITKDNTTLNNQSSTITPQALTAYFLEIDMTQSSAITFRMSDGTTRVELVLSSNLPSATADLFWVFRVVNGNSGATRTIRVGAFYLSTL